MVAVPALFDVLVSPVALVLAFSVRSPLAGIVASTSQMMLLPTVKVVKGRFTGILST